MVDAPATHRSDLSHGDPPVSVTKHNSRAPISMMVLLFHRRQRTVWNGSRIG
jgi:hypothetical protein